MKNTQTQTGLKCGYIYTHRNPSNGDKYYIRVQKLAGGGYYITKVNRNTMDVSIVGNLYIHYPKNKRRELHLPNAMNGTDLKAILRINKATDRHPLQRMVKAVTVKLS